MRKNVNRLLSLLVAAVMLFTSAVIIPAVAEGEDEVIPVYTIEDLYCIRFNLSGHYKLMNDIDLTEATAEGGDWDNAGHGWTPIGGNSEEAFTGTFDGGGHSIIGMRVNNYLYMGLFGKADGAEFTNLRLKNVYMNRSNFNGNTYVGSLVGYCGNTHISYVSSENLYFDVQGYSSSSTGTNYHCYSGGISGWSGTIDHCFTTGTIYSRGYTYCCGIVAIKTNSNTIVSDCYSAVNINGQSGTYNRLYGIAYYGTVKKCMFFGNLIGGTYSTYSYSISDSTPANCYILSGCGGTYSSDTTKVTVLTEETAKLQRMYNALDFENDWFMDVDSGIIHPQLQKLPEKKTVESISWKTKPTVLAFAEGTSLTTDGGIINAAYIDGTTEEISAVPSMVSGFDSSKTGTQTLTVTYGGKTLTYDVTVNHVYTDTVYKPTCNSRGYTEHVCSVCGNTVRDTYVNALQHNYIPLVTDPTCRDMGYTTYTCTLCGDSYVDDWETQCDHNYTVTVVQPTCTETGYTNYTCKDCGASYTADYQPLADHNYTSTVYKPTCTAEGYTENVCSVCGDTQISDYLPPVAHTYTATVTPSTCTAEGFTTYVCTVCGDSYVDDITDADAHDLTARVVKPTCTEGGYTEYSCKHCSFSYKADYTAKLTHEYTTYTEKPTCTAEGYTVYTCEYCKDSYIYDFVPATGHSFGEWEKTASGTFVRRCATCSYAETRSTMTALTVKAGYANKGDRIKATVEISGNVGISYLRFTVLPQNGLEFVSAENGAVLTDLDCGTDTSNIVLSADNASSLNGTVVTLYFDVAPDAADGLYDIALAVRECYDANGNEVQVCSVKGEAQVVSFLYGDADGNGTVDGRDVILLRSYMANFNDNTMTSSVSVAPGADADGDGTVDGRDVVILRKYMANYNDATGTSSVVLGPQ